MCGVVATPHPFWIPARQILRRRIRLWRRRIRDILSLERRDRRRAVTRDKPLARLGASLTMRSVPPRYIPPRTKRCHLKRRQEMRTRLDDAGGHFRTNHSSRLAPAHQGMKTRTTSAAPLDSRLRGNDEWGAGMTSVGTVEYGHTRGRVPPFSYQSLTPAGAGTPRNENSRRPHPTTGFRLSPEWTILSA